MSNSRSSDDGNYSSPVPVIGLYIAAGSLACLLVMIYDVKIEGLNTMKLWLPCKHFALNSVSLTLLGVAAKLTVDLTTPMPSRWDQLSKLTGTAFICVCMGFLALGVDAESESFTNMMSLTILVITVAVNICIQLWTGVIFVFLVEHIIILALMFLLLFTLWQISLEIKLENRIDPSERTSLVTRGEDGLFERLRLCSVQAYCSNPQLKICRYPMNIVVTSLCMACAAIIAQAALRSLLLNKMEFRAGDSDYKWWSMRCIVIIQLVTVLLGPYPMFCRSRGMFMNVDFDYIFVPFRPDQDHEKQLKNTLRAKGITLRLLNFFGYIITKVFLIAQFLTVSPWILVRSFVEIEEDFTVEYFGGCCSATRYSVRKSVDEMIKLKDQVSRSNPNPLYLPYLFKQGFTGKRVVDPWTIEEGSFSIKISTVSMVLLIRIAEASIPKRLLASLLGAFHEAKEVIEYIDKAVNPTKDRDDLEKSIYASESWTGGDLVCMLPRHISPTDLSYKDIIHQLRTTFHDGPVWYELAALIDFITHQHHNTVKELYGIIEGLFVVMLQTFFKQLPRAIFHNLTNAQAAEFEENLKVALEILLRIGSFDAQNNWDFPGGMTCMTRGENPPREEDAIRIHDYTVIFPTDLREELHKIVLVQRVPEHYSC